MAVGVACSRCGCAVTFGTLGACAECGGVLEPRYADARVATLTAIEPGRGIDRYRALLPVTTALPCLGEGDTPLIASRRIGPALGLRHLYFKNEGLNPSGAFKDRAAATLAALALDAGANGVLSASSGNASSAIAAYCAAAGLRCVILMEPGNPGTKLRQTLAAGAQVLPVEGIFAHGPDATRDLIFAVARCTGLYAGFIWAPVNPYILEGIKTIAYEVRTQLGDAPDVVVAPVGGGDMLAAQWRGYRELKRAGVSERLPRMVGVQSHSAPPLLNAFREGAAHVATLPCANSKVSGINVPFTGDHALAAVRESGGAAAGVSDGAVFAMQRRLAQQEGIWVEPAGAAAAAALPGLLERGEIHPDERIVCVMSGAGFKDALLAAQQARDLSEGTGVPFDADIIAGRLARTPAPISPGEGE